MPKDGSLALSPPPRAAEGRVRLTRTTPQGQSLQHGVRGGRLGPCDRQCGQHLQAAQGLGRPQPGPGRGAAKASGPSWARSWLSLSTAERPQAFTCWLLTSASSSVSEKPCVRQKPGPTAREDAWLLPATGRSCRQETPAVPSDATWPAGPLTPPAAGQRLPGWDWAGISCVPSGLSRQAQRNGPSQANHLSPSRSVCSLRGGSSASLAPETNADHLMKPVHEHLSCLPATP